MMEDENLFVKLKTHKNKIITTLLSVFVIVLLCLLNFTHQDLNIDNFRSVIATLLVVYISCNIIYTIHYRQSKEEKELTNKSYIGSKKQYCDRLYIFKNSYDRKDINYYGKQYNEIKKQEAIKEALESVGLIEEDMKLTHINQLKSRYEKIGIELNKQQKKTWKKCKHSKIHYEKINVNVLIHDSDSNNYLGDETGTNGMSAKNEKKRIIWFNISKFITSFAVACISIEFITNPSLETLVKFLIEISAIVMAYLSAITDSDKFIQDRIVEFNKRSTTINSAQIWFKNHPEYKEYTLKYLYGDDFNEVIDEDNVEYEQTINKQNEIENIE